MRSAEYPLARSFSTVHRISDVLLLSNPDIAIKSGVWTVRPA